METVRTPVQTPGSLQALHPSWMRLSAPTPRTRPSVRTAQMKGRVTTVRSAPSKGISGAKATGAVLTVGISVLATGLSRKKDRVTVATCSNCQSTWEF